MLNFLQWLNESTERPRFIYTALKLDEVSNAKLKHELMDEISEGWKLFCHHMTINLGDAAWNYVKQRTSVDLHDILTRLEKEKCAP